MFDGVEIGTVGGQVADAGSPGRDKLLDVLDLMGGEVVKNNHVVFAQFGTEDVLQVGGKDVGVDRPFDKEGGRDAFITQSRNEGGSVPVAVRNGADAAPAHRTAPVEPGHLGVESGFVDKDQLARVLERLGLFPLRAQNHQVRPVLLGGAGSAAVVCAGFIALFFYMMSPSEIDHYKIPFTMQQARQQGCPIILPDSARNVRWQTMYLQVTPGFEILVRFEAAVDVCKSHVQVALDATWEKNDRLPLHPLHLFPLSHAPPPEDKDMVGKAPWFDVEKIKRGLHADSDEMQFWINEDRGVFFCKITD
jgi:hypothetical protein